MKDEVQKATSVANVELVIINAMQIRTESEHSGPIKSTLQKEKLAEQPVLLAWDLSRTAGRPVKWQNPSRRQFG